MVHFLMKLMLRLTNAMESHQKLLDLMMSYNDIIFLPPKYGTAK